MFALGEGKDGSVFATDQQTAIKYLNYAEHYNRELRAYRILSALEIKSINGHAIPELIGWDDHKLAIEMTIVRPPFLLDFVSAYTDEEMDRLGFDDEVWQERQTTWAEHFGPRWAAVQSLCTSFHSQTGLTLLDLSLNNIRFE